VKIKSLNFLGANSFFQTAFIIFIRNVSFDKFTKTTLTILHFYMKIKIFVKMELPDYSV